MEYSNFIFDHLPFIFAIILPLWFISLLIIIVYGSPRIFSSKTKNDNNTSDTSDGNNTDDEKHITINMNKHMASIDITLSLFLAFFVLLVLTKL